MFRRSAVLGAAGGNVFNYGEMFPKKQKANDELVGDGLNFWFLNEGFLPFSGTLRAGSAALLKQIGRLLTLYPDRMIPDRPLEDVIPMRRVMAVNGSQPFIGDNCFIAPNAGVYGDVHLTRKNHVGYSAVVRADGDGKKILVGESSHIMDKAVVTGATNIGKWVTIDCMATVDSADIGSSSFVGASAVVMKGARIESGAMLAASSVLRSGETVQSGELWAGNPAQKIGDLSEEERDSIVKAARHQIFLNLTHNDTWQNSWEDQENIRLTREAWSELSATNRDFRINPHYVGAAPGSKSRYDTIRQEPMMDIPDRNAPEKLPGTRMMPEASYRKQMPAQ